MRPRWTMKRHWIALALAEASWIVILVRAVRKAPLIEADPVDRQQKKRHLGGRSRSGNAQNRRTRGRTHHSDRERHPGRLAH